MWKRILLLIERLFGRQRRGRRAIRTPDARARFWSDVHAGQQEAEAASLPRPVAAPAKS